MVVTQDLVGLEAVSRDGEKLGKVKSVLCDPESLCEYIVIKQSLLRDLVIPARVAERGDAGIKVPFTRAFLDVAPRVSKKGELTSEDRTRLDNFYRSSVV